MDSSEHVRRSQLTDLPSLPANVAETAFLLDFDGTLVDIAPAPDQIVVDPDLEDTLEKLRVVTGDAVAVITGRPISQIDTYLPNIPFAVYGEHGASFRRRPGADIEHVDLPLLPDDWFDKAESLALQYPGTVIERKKNGMVMHFRNGPEAGPAFESWARRLVENSDAFDVRPAKMAWEVRPILTDKGKAVTHVMAIPTFCGKTPLFVGDDTTDLDGIRAAKDLGGKGYLIPDDFPSSRIFRAWLASCSRVSP